MFFKQDTSPADIIIWVKNQIAYTLPIAKNGIDVEIKPHKRQRSNNQNRFLMAILVAVVKFYHETGFVPSDCGKYNIDVESLKTYWKNRWGVNRSSKLDTKNFGEFIDFIQRTLVEETCGEWEIMEPDSAYIRSLLEQGGWE